MQSASTIGISVARKGIILVCLPLIVELGLIVTMTNMVKQAESDAALAMRSTAIIQVGHRLVELAFAAESGCQGYAFTRNPLYVDMYKKAIGDLPGVLKEFHVRPQSSPEQKEAQSQIESLTKKYLSILERDMTQEGIAKEENSLSAEVLSMLQNRIEDFLGEESDIQETRYSAQSSARQALNHFVFFAVGCNIFMAILLSLFFSASITKRLRVMTNNTSLLSAGKPLNEPVGGNDEITHLDRVFHDMADSIKRVEQAKRDFVAMVSHDLKVPLNAVQLFLQALTGGLFGEMPERLRARAEGAEENISRSMKMIKDLLDFEKLDSGNVKLNLCQRNLNDIINRTIETLAPFASKHKVEILFNNENAVCALVDEDRFTQILANLLTNAIKFSPENSIVKVSCESKDEFIHVAVSDKGKGIAEELQKEIFEAFKQAHTKDTKDIEGSGLGLAICKKLVEIHSGELTVESRPLEGSTFRFTIPIKPPGTQQNSETKQNPVLNSFVAILIAFTACSCNAKTKESVHISNNSEAFKRNIAETRKSLAEDNYERALQSSEETIKTAPDSQIAHLFHGYAKYKLNRAEESISDFTTAIRLGPDNYQGYEYRAAAYQTMKRFRKAVKDYTHAIHLAADNASTRAKLNKELGICYLSYGALNEAKESLSEALKYNSSDASLYALKATAELHLNALQECLSDANQSIELDSKNAQAYQVRSRLLSILDQPEAAISDEKKARELFAQQLNYEELTAHK